MTEKTGTTTAPAKRGRKPAQVIENPETLTGAAAEAFNKKPEWEQAEIRAKYMAQEARKLKEAAGVSTSKKKGAGGATTRASVPAFTLAHSFGLLNRNQFVPPADGSRPEASALRAAKDFGVIAPLLATPAETAGLYELLDGRDFYLIPEDKPVPVVVITGFPAREWRDAAAAVYMSARGANVFGLSATLGRLRAGGWEDKHLRTRLGLKAGEIEKYESLGNLPADIAQGVREGRVTSGVALLVAKQTPAIREALAETFRKLTAEKADARLTEAHVEEARKARTTAAVQRDAPALGAAVASTPASVETAGGGIPQASAVEGLKPAAPLLSSETPAPPTPTPAPAPAPAFVSTMPPNATTDAPDASASAAPAPQGGEPGNPQ